MLTYEKRYPIEVAIDRPDFKSYLLLDQELQGTKIGFQCAMSYIRDSFMINNDDFRFMFMQIGIKHMNHMELLAKLLHLLHGSDDRYYDESNDDTPTKELIPPLQSSKEKEPSNDRHVNNDITACVMFHLQEEHKLVKQYEEVDHMMQDSGAHHMFAFMIEGMKENITILKGILHTLSSPNEIKDFGLGDSENAWSANSGNYFDKPNPEFLNPSQLSHLPKE